MISETRICQNCKNQFVIAPDDFSFYEKMGVPAPKICPQCRFQRKCLWRNETTLYSRVCDLCGKSMISMYSPDSPYVVYCLYCYHSDKWNAFDYAKEYNPHRTFFDQLKDLVSSVPKAAVYHSSFANSVNCEYINFAGGKQGSKNCYLVFNGAGEDLIYTRGVRMPARNVVDCYYSYGVENCYEIINVRESTGITFGQNVSGSLDSAFLFGCSNCHNCFGCVNLRNKSYHFFNKRIDKEEYRRRVDELRGSYVALQKFRRQFDEFRLKFLHRSDQNIKAVNSSGDFLSETNNVNDSFEVAGAENCRYTYFAGSSKEPLRDSYDVLGFGYNSEQLLETMAVGFSQRAIASAMCSTSQNIEYCVNVKESSNCLGCDGIKNGEYAILNRRYSKAAFNDLRSKIVKELEVGGEYGLFFPPSLAPFAYNETIGQDNFPLTKEEAIKNGFSWEDDVQITRGKETIQPEKLPDHIKDVSDSITKDILKCIGCGRNYKIIPAELDFYRQMTLPIPRQCFYCRHADRLRRRGPFKLHARNCAKCGKRIQTIYAPDRPEIVYCESCYNSEVI